MKSKNLVICDTEEGYARALGIFFTRKKELMLQVHICSHPKCVISVAKEMKVDILLITADCIKEVQEKIKAEAVFILGGGESCMAVSDYPVLYKYQSGEKLLNQMVKECPELFDSGNIVRNAVVDKKKKIIGIFSPVHRVGKTAYALKLGEELAQSENVLYLNLEVFGGTGGRFEQNGQTLADILYYARQEKGNLGLMITTLIGHKGNLDYVCPMPVSEDMKSVRGSEWAKLMKQILEQSIYETLILDIDEGIPELYCLLEICAEIHMHVLEDEYSKAKIQHFEGEMSLLGHEDILKRIVRKGGRL